MKIKGTINGICFYCLDGEFYARAKSSLSGERVKTDPAFAETMRYAQRMGSASTIASEIYKMIVPQHERSRDRFREMVRMVMREMDAALRLHEFEPRNHEAERSTKKKLTTNYTNGHE